MKERPIIFNGEMVRAILDGRKTQTRRVISPQPEYRHGVFYEPNDSTGLSSGLYTRNCLLGAVGDRLWVREAWQAIHDSVDGFGAVDETTYMPSILKKKDSYWHPVYAADNWTTDPEERGFPWRPSIHMPRWASPITLEITSVRVERLNDISEEDAEAEGFTSSAVLTEAGDDYTGLYPSEHFAEMWNSIYGPFSFYDNPFVWVIEFKRVGA